MSVAPATAADLVSNIYDLQRALRCVTMVNIKGQDTGIALQGVLRFIGEGETRAAHLAERLGVSPPVLSRHVAELADAGLVVRTPDPHDGRAQLLALSPRGQEKLAQVVRHRTETLQAYLADWNEDDAAATAAMLSKLTTSLKNSIRARAAGITTEHETQEPTNG
ncbi:DNA-binding MarR family transcriptional regulator [Arthrobacter ulcerisalmonis]|uniref:MarR family winged helix-turn-helix transcriptional regulator n=1 Tax=Arthrobacter sp. B1I2 TaxID=3042263 RepID=UPI00278070A3|nr:MULTISPECIES: MarR family transcriptional regulator [Arthrobacter]MDQ0665585.1 DNA-binding MarR family transcriptional regulator [Arthrobacter ulcerisalmonis]MDQ0729298.1 DNA-binding MarR family transcriptional regulator [Arthrobacter sp. B1I2]